MDTSVLRRRRKRTERTRFALAIGLRELPVLRRRDDGSSIHLSWRVTQRIARPLRSMQSDLFNRKPRHASARRGRRQMVGRRVIRKRFSTAKTYHPQSTLAETGKTRL